MPSLRLRDAARGNLRLQHRGAAARRAVFVFLSRGCCRLMLLTVTASPLQRAGAKTTRRSSLSELSRDGLSRGKRRAAHVPSELRRSVRPCAEGLPRSRRAPIRHTAQYRAHGLCGSGSNIRARRASLEDARRAVARQPHALPPARANLGLRSYCMRSMTYQLRARPRGLPQRLSANLMKPCPVRAAERAVLPPRPTCPEPRHGSRR